MATAPAKSTSFEDRLARIQRQSRNTMGEVHIGPSDTDASRDKPSTNKVRVKSKKKKVVKIGEGSNAVFLPLAFIVGGFSLFVGMSAKYHMFEEGGLIPMEVPIEALAAYTPYVHFLIGGLLALLFAWSFGFTSLVRKLAVIAGFAGMFYYETAVVERFPGTFTIFFSEAYVAEKLTSA